jgi:predicted PurR-regulated permease PerM
MDSPRPLAARDLWLLLGTLVLGALTWVLADVLLLVFGAVLLALVLLAMARPLHRRLGLPPRAALVLVLVLLGVVLAGGATFTGAAAADELQALRQTLPRAFEAARRWVDGLPGGRVLLGLMNDLRLLPEDWAKLAGLASGTLNATAAAGGALVLLLFLAIYLAADPLTYRQGVLRLVPRHQRALADRTLSAVGHDLSRWLLGQAVSMSAVGLLTAAGLFAIGMPLAGTLAVLAALLDFVPYIGPIASGALIVAIALAEGEQQALWALGVCVAVQQAEAYVVQPLAQRWAVRLAPVLGLLAVLVFGLLFGIAGVLLAVPLMVMCQALVRCLWIEAALGDR